MPTAARQRRLFLAPYDCCSDLDGHHLGAVGVKLLSEAPLGAGAIAPQESRWLESPIREAHVTFFEPPIGPAETLLGENSPLFC
jgi:hypothetical protein